MSSLQQKMAESQLCLSQAAGLDLLFDYIDEQFESKQTAAQLNVELDNLNIEPINDIFLIGLLTATFEGRKYLPARAKFYERSYHLLVKVRGKNDSIIEGLEQGDY
jgi:hypothetical protein